VVVTATLRLSAMRIGGRARRPYVATQPPPTIRCPRLDTTGMMVSPCVKRVNARAATGGDPNALGRFRRPGPLRGYVDRKLLRRRGWFGMGISARGTWFFLVVGAAIGLALGILVSVTTDVPLAPEAGLVLGALAGWLSRRVSA
jgi:hypothetical protein